MFVLTQSGRQQRRHRTEKPLLTTPACQRRVVIKPTNQRCQHIFFPRKNEWQGKIEAKDIHVSSRGWLRQWAKTDWLRNSWLTVSPLLLLKIGVGLKILCATSQLAVEGNKACHKRQDLCYSKPVSAFRWSRMMLLVTEWAFLPSRPKIIDTITLSRRQTNA